MRVPNVFLFLLVPTILFAQPAKWELVRENFRGRLAIAPDNAEVIFITPGEYSIQGIFKSTDAGRTWTGYEEGYKEMGGVGGFVFDPMNSQRMWIYGGHLQAVRRSEDGGETAVRADSGMQNDGHYGFLIYGFAYDAPNHVLYISEKTYRTMYRSLDGGRSWHVVPAFENEYPFQPGFLFVEQEAGWVYSAYDGDGIWRSKDRGVTWQKLQLGLRSGEGVLSLAAMPNSNTLVALVKPNRFFKSYDRGESWQRIASNLSDSIFFYPWAVSSLDTSWIFAGAGGTRRIAKGGFYFSNDGGNTWRVHHLGLPQFELWDYSVWSLAQTPTHLYMSLKIFNRTLNTEDLYHLEQAQLTRVSETSGEQLPLQLVLSPNYPNPFSPLVRGIFGNPSTQIRFNLPRANKVAVRVFDMSGREVATLFEGARVAGPHSFVWEGKNTAGEVVRSGVYFLRLEAGGEVAVRKMALVR